MRKLNVAVIGQGRSGKDIHCAYFLSDRNKHFNVKYIVDFNEARLEIAKKLFPGVTTYKEYTDLFNHKDIDLIVVSVQSNLHYEIAKDILEHGYNVLVEKPMARTKEECDILIETAKKNNVKLAVFQQSQYAPYCLHAKKVIESGILGNILQITLHWNGFARRWDWQTLQSKVGGNVYNTGPHPIGIGLSLIDFDKNFKVVYSRLANTPNSSGDSDDFAKILIEAPNKPLLDIEISSVCAHKDYFILISGDHGNFKTNITGYKMKYYLDEENKKQELVTSSLMDKNYNPLYCVEEMNWHEEEGEYNGTAFEVGTQGLYEDLYFYITENRPMRVTAEMGRDVIRVCEFVHEQNPLAIKF